MGKLKKVGIAFGVIILLFIGLMAIQVNELSEGQLLGDPIVFFFGSLTSTDTNEQPKVTTPKVKTFSQMNEQELEQLAIPWEYRDMLRNPENYRGEILSISGPVYFVSNSVVNPTSPLYGGNPNSQLLAFEVSCPNYDCRYIGVEHQGEKILEGDRVQIYAEFKNLYTGIPFPAGGEKPFLKSHFLECFNCN